MSRGPIVLDTDVVSYSFRDSLTSRARTLLTDRTWSTTFVTVGELTKWMRVRWLGPRRQAEIGTAAGFVDTRGEWFSGR